MIDPAGDTSDAALVGRARAGDQAAYRVLLHRHRDAVFRLARGHPGGDAGEALDIVQESFVAAFAALHRYDPQRPFRVWLLRIALNKARDWSRRRTVRRFFTRAQPLDAIADPADSAPTPEAAAHSSRELARIERAIAALPAPLRQVLLLRAVDGMSQALTAETLSISEKAVETRLYRARRALSALLEMA